MRQRLPLILSIMALVVALAGVGGPALGHGVKHALFAHKADKVDGRHAVGSAASPARRAGKLVATNSHGRLPNGIIAKAPDANRIDGIDSVDLLPGGVLSRGVTIRGHYANMGRTDGADFQIASHGISFGYRLSAAPTARVRTAGAAPTEECPGSVSDPQAAPGYLCVYEYDSRSKRDASYPSVGFGGTRGATTVFGAHIYTQSNTNPSEFFWSRGTWAVTAP